MEEIKIPMELENTVAAMLSDDYKERLKAEHRQVTIRMTNLMKYLGSISSEEMYRNPHINRTLCNQLLIMQLYQNILEERAETEEIDLYKWDN